jgi:hypothetical protein
MNAFFASVLAHAGSPPYIGISRVAYITSAYTDLAGEYDNETFTCKAQEVPATSTRRLVHDGGGGPASAYSNYAGVFVATFCQNYAGTIDCGDHSNMTAFLRLKNVTSTRRGSGTEHATIEVQGQPAMFGPPTVPSAGTIRASSTALTTRSI